MLSEEIKSELLVETLKIMDLLNINIRTSFWDKKDGDIKYVEGSEYLGAFFWNIADDWENPETRVYKDPTIALNPRARQLLLKPKNEDEGFFGKSLVVHELTHYLQVADYKILQGWPDYHIPYDPSNPLLYYSQQVEFEAFTVCSYYYLVKTDHIDQLNPDDGLFRERLIDLYLQLTGGVAVFN
ncbi:hypothetical protein BKI52_32930 [marine bacterium AO1-C]|nr:hypothetical protein BKI52_32930 [marine bacterium AO1-C]